MRNSLIAALVSLLVAPVAAKSFMPRTNIEIVALDLATGAEKWAAKGTPLANAHFELYPDVLVAYPHYDNTDKTSPLFFDPATGKVTKDTRDPSKLLKKSWAQWIRDPIVLANGWRIDDFRPGYVKDLEVVDPKTTKVAWTVKNEHYPEYVYGYKDLLLVAYGYLTNEAVIFAHRAGGKQAWSIDFNKLLKPKPRLGRVVPQIIGDVLYAQTGPHVFAIAPDTGKILWQIDAAALLGVAYEPDIYGGALDVAVFARDGDTLVVSFEKRVFAVRASTGTLLWSMEPDTFPHTAFPLVHGGVVYITAGPKRGKAVTPPKTASR